MRDVSVPLIVLGVLGASAACSPADEPREAPGSSVQSAIQGGVNDTTHTFAVGVLRKNPSSTDYCSEL